MTAELTVVPDEIESRRKQAILRAVGLDKATVEQRELALAIAKKFDLDLMLKHLVLIEGRPYITRDALLWIAHRSGHFDGLTVTKPEIVGDFWECSASAYRTDMSHPFTYPGRYPAKGGNQKFAPEMAIKVAESMALRRAFNISAPTQDERWDVDATHADEHTDDTQRLNSADTMQGSPARPTSGSVTAEVPIPESAPLDANFTPLVGVEVPEDGQREPPATVPKGTMVQCLSISPLSGEQCRREEGHAGNRHRTQSESWTEG